MNTNAKISLILNELLNDKDYISTLMKSQGGDLLTIQEIQINMSKILEYYIMTKDTKKRDFNYIQDKLSQIDDNFDSNPKIKENVINSGVLTHSFGGYKKNRIKKYGLNYYHQDSIKDDISYGRSILNKLEELINKSNYTKSEEKSSIKDSNMNTIFLCSPGAKTIGYALSYSPERLYMGPLHGINSFPIIVGETKKQYVYRFLQKKLQETFQSNNSKEYNQALNVAKEVSEYYCTENPCFAMIDIEKIKDIPFCHTFMNENNLTPLDNILKDMSLFNSSSFFTYDLENGVETNNLENLVTYAEYIPKDASHIVQVLDKFEIIQEYSMQKGAVIGEVVDQNGDKMDKYPNLYEIIPIINNIKDPFELNELKSTTDLIYNSKLNNLSVQKEQLQNLFGNKTDYELQNILENIKQEKEQIYNRGYISKNNTLGNEKLIDVLNNMKKNGTFDNILIQDENILSDPLQFSSSIHGKDHTRRVSFLASIIADKENLNKQDRLLLFEIAKNHDIGRINDYEDKEHGKNSAEIVLNNINRLKDLSDEDKEILYFVITQHSKSKSENDVALNKLKEDKAKLKILSNIGQYNSEYIENNSFLKNELKKDPYFLKSHIEKIRKYYNLDTSDLSYSDENITLINKINEEYTKLKNKNYTKINIDRCAKLLKIFKDADKLDRVRLDPSGLNKDEGLNINRLNLESSKSLETLAYENLDKYCEIIDIEKKEKLISDYFELLKDLDCKNEIDNQINKSKFKNKNKLVNTIKNFLLKFSKKNESIVTLPSTNQAYENDYSTKFFNDITSQVNDLDDIVPSQKNHTDTKMKDYDIEK